MNYRQVEIFTSVLESGSVTAAAQKLGLSQPAVSKSLKLLENELKTRLFLRGSKGLQPTDEGRALYLEASRLVDGYTHLELFARNLPRMEHARFQISCIPALSIEWLPRTIAGFVQKYPDASFTFRSRSSPETVQLVARGEIDLGISQARTDDSSIEKTKLFDLRAVCIVPVWHRLATVAQIDFSDLDGERIISLSAPDELQRGLEAAMLTRGLRFTSRLEISLGAMACRMAEAGEYVGIIDEESARLHDPTKSRIVPFAESISTPVCLLRNVNKPKTLALSLFTDHIISRISVPARARGIPGKNGGHEGE